MLHGLPRAVKYKMEKKMMRKVRKYLQSLQKSGNLSFPTRIKNDIVVSSCKKWSNILGSLNL
jgi:hypothetical protein